MHKMQRHCMHRVIKMQSKRTGTRGDFPRLICSIYGPPGGCGAPKQPHYESMPRAAFEVFEVKQAFPNFFCSLQMASLLHCKILIKRVPAQLNFKYFFNRDLRAFCLPTLAHSIAKVPNISRDALRNKHRLFFFFFFCPHPPTTCPVMHHINLHQ